MTKVSLDLPTHLIDVPAGQNCERYYYIPIHNIPVGGAEELINRRLRKCNVIDWQFHNDAHSGWVCFAHEEDFEMALGSSPHDTDCTFPLNDTHPVSNQEMTERLQEMKQLNPKLEYSDINKLESFKLEVIDCTLTQPRFVRLYSSHAKGTPRRKNDLMDWVRLDLPSVGVGKTQRILLTGLTSRPNIHEFNVWLRSKLRSDCLLVVVSRIARIGVSHALVFICTLAVTKELCVDKIEDLLQGAMFGSETVRVLVERLDSAPSAVESRQDVAPLVVLGSSKLPSHWPSIVSKWTPSVGRIEEGII